jgi:L-2-amino-thiazoline-4-carboxylic acid hydrolase
MSSNPKWETPITMTLMEYFATPFLVPHEGFVKLVRELEKEIGKEKTHKIVAKVRDDCARELAEKMADGKKFNSFNEFLENFIPAINSQIGIGDASEGYVEESPDNALIANYTSCIYPEIYKKWDAMDIGYLWNCLGDHVMINSFCENVTFDLPECLMQGDEKCKYCFKWDEKK